MICRKFEDKEEYLIFVLNGIKSLDYEILFDGITYIHNLIHQFSFYETDNGLIQFNISSEIEGNMDIDIICSDVKLMVKDVYKS